jgi:hypothetical protein
MSSTSCNDRDVIGDDALLPAVADSSRRHVLDLILAYE